MGMVMVQVTETEKDSVVEKVMVTAGGQDWSLVTVMVKEWALVGWGLERLFVSHSGKRCPATDNHRGGNFLQDRKWMAMACWWYHRCNLTRSSTGQTGRNHNLMGVYSLWESHRGKGKVFVV